MRCHCEMRQRACWYLQHLDVSERCANIIMFTTCSYMQGRDGMRCCCFFSLIVRPCKQKPRVGDLDKSLLKSSNSVQGPDITRIHQDEPDFDLKDQLRSI